MALATLFGSVALLVGVVSVSTGGSSKAAQTAGSAIGGSSTATVQRRDLVQTDTETGTIGHTDTRDVYNHLSGTVTWLPRAGAVIKDDQALYRVDGRGVYLLYGTIPAYRSFSSGMSDGADVAELNRGLRALGYDPSNEIATTNNRHYGQGTIDAVERWQKAHGLSQTGTIDLGRVVFLPGRRRIETVDLGIGGPASSSSSGTGTGSTATTASYAGSSSTTASAVYHMAAGSGAQFISLTTSSGNPGASTTTTPMATTTTTPMATTTTTTPTAPTSTSPITITTPSATITTPSTTVITKCTTTTSGGTTTVTTTTAATPKKKPGSGKHKPAKTSCPSSSSGSQPSTNTSSSAAAGGGSAPTGGGSASTPSSSGGTGSSGAGGGATASTAGASAGGASSAATQSGNVALVTTSTDTVVTVPLDTSKQTEAVVGAPVQVTLPSTRLVSGKITSVASVAVASSSSSSGSSTSSGSSGSSTSSTVAVDITLARAATRSKDAQLDQAPVTVAFAQQEQRNALSIPVTALVATAGGGYAVNEMTGTGRTLVPVTPGLYAGGYVSISGNVSEGTTVTNGSQ